MLESVIINNFKCFEHVSIPLKALSVFSGINGVGKSSALQSLLLLRQSMSVTPPMARLNGPLVSLGYAEDILYEYAKENDNIVFVLNETDGSEQKFSFQYAKGSQELEMCQGPTSCAGPLFSEGFVYLNAERIGPRASFSALENTHRSINPIGNSGEYTAWMLARNERRGIAVPSLCHTEAEGNALGLQVEAWMSDMGQKIRIHVNEHRYMDCVSLQFSFMQNGRPSDNYRTTNVGFGLTYSLPIFVSVLLARPGALLCIENPEAHLHPKAQTLMGEFLARAAAAGIQIILETHSDHVLNGIRIAVKRALISPEQISLNFFYRNAERNSTSLITPALDPDGRITQWPSGFFDEWENSLSELL